MKILKYDTSNNIRAFSTLRGKGSDNYAEFNITHYCGDAPKHVAECREKLCKKLDIEDKSLILPRQTHGNKVFCIEKEFTSLCKERQSELLQGIDAIITDVPRTCIGVSTADCIPILLYDSTKGVVAAVHAGWRGTVARILNNCITEMICRYRCKAEEIKAIIAPGISMDSFEVGDEVYEEFAKAGFQMNEIARRYPSGQGEKWHIDLWEANRLQMINAGIKEENITMCGICTYKHHNDFFSARRLGINSGRIFNGIINEKMTT